MNISSRRTGKKKQKKIQNCEIGGTHHENNRNYESQKGGIGKTMTAASIAYLLGEEQERRCCWSMRISRAILML